MDRIWKVLPFIFRQLNNILCEGHMILNIALICLSFVSYNEIENS